MSYCIQPTCNKQNPDNIKFCFHCGHQLLLRDRYRAIKQIGQGGFGRTLILVTKLDFPAFILFLPIPLVQKTGDAVLSNIVKSVSGNFSERISRNFIEFLKI